MVKKSKVPEGYKLTELGVIPEDWKVSKWGDVLDGFTSGATPYRAIKSYYKGNVKWVTSGELNYNYIYDTIEHISKEAVEKTHLKIHPSGTFLMAITGLEAEGTRGSCGILGSPATTNQSCMAIYGTDKVTVNYLFYYYLMFGNDLAFKYCQGTKQQSYTAKIVKNLPIIHPINIKEQQAIAEVLSDVDNLITSLEKLIDKKQKIKQGIMQELLTGRKRLPGFTGEWEVKKVKEFGEIVTGGTPSTVIKEFWNGKIPWVTPTDISNRKEIYDTERKITELGLNKLRKLPAGSVLITCIASIGKNAILKIAGACNQQINAIIPYSDYDSDFLYYLFENNKRYLLSNAGITATNIISKKDFSELEFKVPMLKNNKPLLIS